MKINGIRLAEGSEIENLVVDSGSVFPGLPDLGELFYLNDPLVPETIGLHVYNGFEWGLLLLINNGRLDAQSSITADYTLQNSDNDDTLFMDNGIVDITITVPAGLPDKFKVSILQRGTGDVVLEADIGVTLQSPYSMLTLQGQHYGAFLEQDAQTDTFQVIGSLRE